MQHKWFTKPPPTAQDVDGELSKLVLGLAMACQGQRFVSIKNGALEVQFLCESGVFCLVSWPRTARTRWGGAQADETSLFEGV